MGNDIIVPKYDYCDIEKNIQKIHDVKVKKIYLRVSRYLLSKEESNGYPFIDDVKVSNDELKWQYTINGLTVFLSYDITDDIFTLNKTIITQSKSFDEIIPQLFI